MNKLIIAPDSFKGSLSAIQVCEIIASAARRYFPEAQVVKIPLADGGEGFVEAMLLASGGNKVWVEVKDPLEREIQAAYGVLPDKTAVIEIAAACGLPLLSQAERSAMKTTSFGAGQLIRHALQQGFRKFLIGLGGSATNDGGAGLAAALGIRYLTKEKEDILSGAELVRLEHIDTHNQLPELQESQIILACDVKNPLYGPQGAAYTYAPQKGATPQDVETLDCGLQQLAQVVLQQTGLDLQKFPGSGAAGGMAVPLLAFAGAELTSGLDIVLNAFGFEQQLDGCDLVITGEGRTDAQSTMGKVILGIGRRAKARHVPVIVISGSLEAGYENLYSEGITAMFSTCRQVSTLEQALEKAQENLVSTAEDVFRLIKIAIFK